MTGIVATTVFAYFARELLLNNRFLVRHGTAVIVLLFGTAGASAPVGSYVFNEQLWPWFLIGEGVFFIPYGIMTSIRFTFWINER
jgi:hypothetical protein